MSLLSSITSAAKKVNSAIGGSIAKVVNKAVDSVKASVTSASNNVLKKSDPYAKQVTAIKSASTPASAAAKAGFSGSLSSSVLGKSITSSAQSSGGSSSKSSSSSSSSSSGGGGGGSSGSSKSKSSSLPKPASVPVPGGELRVTSGQFGSEAFTSSGGGGGGSAGVTGTRSTYPTSSRYTFGPPQFATQQQPEEDKKKQEQQLQTLDQAKKLGFLPSNPLYGFNAKAPEVLKADDAGRDATIGAFSPKDTVTGFQEDMTGSWMDEYGMRSRTNPPIGGYIGDEQIFGGATASSDAPGGLTLVNPQTGASFFISDEQAGANPEYWKSVVSELMSGGWTPQATAGVEEEVPLEGELQMTEEQTPYLTKVADVYKQMQDAAGVPKIIAEIKDIQNQQLAAKEVLDARRDDILEDPDFSLGSRSARLNYLFNDSAEARTYEAATRRLEALGSLLSQANSEINQRMSLYSPYFNAYAQSLFKSDENTGEGDIKEIGGSVYVYNKATGRWENRGASGTSGLSQQDSLALQSAYKGSDIPDQWGTVSSHYNNVFSQFNEGDFTTDENGKITITQQAIDRIRSDGFAIGTMLTSLGRMQKPDISRTAEGDVQAQAVAGSIIGATTAQLEKWISDSNMPADKFRELVNQSIKLRNTKYTQARDYAIEFLYSNPQAAGAIPGIPLSSAEQAFVAESRKDGHPVEQVKDYLKKKQVTSNGTGAARTDRHNNPTAFTTDVAKTAGLIEGRDYVAGDPFPDNPNLRTARIIGDPIATTIKVIDRIGFTTASGKQRWSYINIPKATWDQYAPEQKRQVIAQMYKREGGTTLASLFGNTA